MSSNFQKIFLLIFKLVAVLITCSTTLTQSYKLGCYQETRVTRTENVLAGNYDPGSVTESSCCAICTEWGFRYAGISAQTVCFCSNTLISTTIAPDASCNSASSLYVWVYEVPMKVANLALTSNVGTTTAVATGTAITFTMTWTNAPTNVVFYVNFGENDDLQTFPAMTSPHTFTRKFFVPGNYLVTVSASENTSVSLMVSVHQPLSGFTIFCPPKAATFNEIKCNGTVNFGNNLNVVLDYGDGLIETFYMSDAHWFTAGRGIAEIGTLTSSSVSATTYFNPSSQFKEAAMLIGFEYFSSVASGTINFLLIQSACSATTDNYCYNDNSCSGAAVCTVGKSSCTSPQIFCPLSSACSDATPTTCSPAKDRYNIVPTLLNYVRLPCTIAGSGHQFFQLTTPVAVNPGDMVGLETLTLTGAIGTVTAGTDEIPDKKIGTTTGSAQDLLSGYTATTIRHLFRGVSYRPSYITMPHTYENIGVMNYIMTVTDSDLSISLTSTATIIVVIGINDTTITGPPFGKTNQPVRFDTLPHSGSNVTYTWDTGDGTTLHITTDPFLSYPFPTRGCYDVNVTSANVISGKMSNKTHICIEDEILSLVVTNEVSAATMPSNFHFSMASGSNFSCNWTYGDSVKEKSDDVSTPIAGTTKTHMYVTDGTFQVSVSCANNVSSARVDLVQYVQWPIVNLRFDKVAVPANVPFSIVMKIDQGTNPTFNVTFNHTEEAVTYDSITKTATSVKLFNLNIGVYPVHVVAWNQFNNMTLTDNFTVEIPLQNAAVECLTTETAADRVVDYRASFTAGSGVTISWDFGDDDPFLLAQPPATPNPSGLSQIIPHKFRYGNFFNTKATMKNALDILNFTCDIEVYGKIENVTLEGSVSASFINNAGLINLFFTATQNLINHYVVFDFGDGSPKQKFNFSTKATYEYKYTKVGTYIVSANVSNKVEFGILDRDIIVAIQVANMAIITKVPHATLAEPFEVGVVLDNSNSVRLFFDFGDPLSPDNFYDMPRTPDATSYVPDYHSHTYNQIGVYQIIVRAENVIGNTTMRYLVVVQNPVPNTFVLQTNVAAFPPGIVYFNLSLPNGATLPDNATVTFDLGDGRLISAIPLAFTTPPYLLSLQNTFLSDGVYNVIVVISNLASSFNITRQVGVYMKFSDFKLTPLFASELSAGSTGVSGLGPNGDIFPIGSPMVMDASFSAGKADYFTVEIKDSSGILTTLNMTKSPFSIDFASLNLAPGQYSIKVTAVNGVDSVSQTINVNLQNLLKAPTVSSTPNPSDPTAVDIQITFADTSASACLVIDYGDGTHAIFALDPKACANTSYANWPFTQLSSLVSPVSIPPPPHKYPNDGTYELVLKAIDLSGTYQSKVITSVPVNSTCPPPSLTIKNQSSDFFNPLLHDKSQQLDVIGETNILCAKTLNNVKKWTVWTVDPQTGQLLTRLAFLDQEKTAIQAQLTVLGWVLPYGLYKFTYNVSVPAENMYSTVSTFIKIVPSAIVAFIVPNGMSQITRGFNSTVVLSPETNSYDPDIEDRNVKTNFTAFQWFCRQKDEKFPSYTNGTYLPYPKHKIYTAETFRAANLPNTGGCFGTGPGLLDFTKGTLEFSSSMMKINDSYIFSVVVSIGARSSTTELRVDIVEGNPPSIVIGCQDPALCQPKAIKIRVNPSNRLTLFAKCIENCVPGAYFSWSASRLGLNGAWLMITTFAEYVDGIDGVRSDVIGFPSQLFLDGFQLYQGLSNYRFDATMTPPPGQGGVEGKAYIEVVLNANPKGGNCSIFPLEGVSASTKFTVQCTGWQDEDGIKVYQFFATSPADPQTRIQLGLNDKGTLDAFTLPTGADAYGYNLQITARILDNFDCATDFPFVNVSVRPMTSAESSEMVKGLLGNATTSNKLLSLAANGDIRQTSTIFLGIAETLNQDSSYKTADAANTSLKSIADPFQATEQLIDNQGYQIERDQRAALKSKMVQALNNVTISDILSVQLVASTMSVLTKVPSEINRDDQKTMTKTIDYMADTLSRLASKTPLEEVKVGAQSLVQTVGNILQSAVYGQSDGTIQDIKEAKKDPLYFYDTDWESPRKGFVGLSKEAMEKGLQSETNTLVQKEAAKKTVSDLLKSIEQVNKVMMKKIVPGEEPVQVNSPAMSVALMRDTPARIEGKPISSGGGDVTLPSLCEITGKSNCSSKDSVGVELITTPRNIFSHLPTPPGVANFSSTVTLNLYDDSGNPISVANLTKPIQISIPRNFMPPIGTEAQNATAVQFRDESTMLYYRFSILPSDGSVTVKIVPQNQSVQFLTLLKQGSYPLLNGSRQGWDYMQNLPINITKNSKNNYTAEERYTLFINSDTIKGRNGTWFLGIRQLQEKEFDSYSDAVTPKPPPLKSGQPTTNFSVLIYTSGCHYCTEKDDEWHSSGCKVSPLTRIQKTVCLCTHLTSFAGGFIVQPNTIDFDFIMKNADFMKNPTLYIMEIVLAVLYVVIAIWARWKDKKDVEKLGVTPLPDNDANDKYLYEVIVATGQRRNAGTKSKVFVIFSGDMEETDARTLEDNKRTIFKRGAVDSFLMTTPRPLGALNYARIWHDNSGKGKYASWYLSWILVRDIQTQEKFHFIVNQWFAVEEEDGQISRLVSIASRAQMVETGHAFSKRATKGLNDDHIWFSIVSRPAQSRFTRLQRLSCCLCLLFTAMFANALFYGTTENTSSQGLEIGPFTVTPEQLYVGFISNLVVFPINFIIAYLFKNSRPRKKRPSRIAEAVKKIKEENKQHASNIDLSSSMSLSSLGNEKRPILGSEYGGKSYCDPLEPQIPKTYPGPPLQQQAWNIPAYENESGFQDSQDPQKKKKKKKELPWWCVIIGWILLWLTMVGAVAGVTFYGIMFQDAKSRKWITSMLISFVTSILFTQPIKVILVALLFSMIFKKPTEEEEDDSEDDEESPNLEYDEDWLHTAGPPKPRTIVYNPPDPSILEKAREKRLKEIQMYAILREILFYVFFIYVLVTVSYDFRDVNSYDYKNSLATIFTSGGSGDPKPDNSIDLVRSMDNMWNWLNNTFIPGVRVDNWYNNDPPMGMRGYLNDYVSRIMGFATLRQLRVRPKLCTVYGGMRAMMKECNVPYSYSDEDKADYGPGWTPLGNTSSANVLPEYHYRTSEELDGFPFMGTHEVYSGGGYMVELRGDRKAIRSKINSMKESGWIDRYTRAVFVEFAAYNSQVNLFGVVHIVAELLTSGGFDCYYRFDTMNLLGSLGSSRLVQYVLQGLFVLCIVIFVVKEVRNVIKQRKAYFTQYWNWVEWFIIVCSIVCICMYVYRSYMTNKLTSIFAKSGGNSYMKFTGVAYWNEMLLYLLGILLFWTNIKFLKLLRFNKTIGLLSSTLRYCSKTLINFCIMFGLVFFAFIHCFYLIYLPSLEVFSDLIRTAEQCLMMMVGKFNFSDMAKASPVLGTLLFFLYMIMVFFILMTMFVGIISDAFSVVRDDIKKQSNDHEMVDFIIDRIKQWIGLNKYFGTSKKVQPGQGVAGPYDPSAVDALPDRLDKFLDSVSKVYFNHDTFESLFKDGTSNPGGKKMMAAGGKKGYDVAGLEGRNPPKKFDPNPKGRGFPGID